LTAPGASRTEAFEPLRAAVEADRGDAGEPLPVADRQPAPWETSMEAVCESLAMRGAIEHLERRNAEDALGETTYSDAPAHTRPALATAHTLLERGVISEEELRAKMDAVRRRFEAR
jgi:hypothetical protein